MQRSREDNTDAMPSDQPTNGELQATSIPKRVPQGAVLVDKGAPPMSDEMINLLRKPRYVPITHWPFPGTFAGYLPRCVLCVCAGAAVGVEVEVGVGVGMKRGK